MFVGVRYREITDCICYDKRQQIIIKHFHKGYSREKREIQKNNLQNEAKILEMIEHNYIIRPLKIIKDQNKQVQAIHLESLKCNFNQLLSKLELIDFKWLKQQIKNIVGAIQYLHEKDIVHNDIRCENIMYSDKEGKAVLIDLGRATKFPYHKTVSEFIEHWIQVYDYWQGPQLHQIFVSMGEKFINKQNASRFIRNKDYSKLPEIFQEQYEQTHFDYKKNDIYQFGLMLWLMVSGQQRLKNTDSECSYYDDQEKREQIFQAILPYNRTPSPEDDKYQLFLNKNYKEIYQLIRDSTDPRWFQEENKPEHLLDLICSCFQTDLSLVPTADQLLGFEWLNF